MDSVDQISMDSVDFDADGYARQPDEWRSRLKTKETVLKDFYSTFGSADKKDPKNDHFISGADHTTAWKSVKSGALNGTL
ncbi:hypothetical protein QQ045_011450 [Rhodiola kirilowii]